MKGHSGAAQEKKGEASGEAAACKMGLLRTQIPQEEKTACCGRAAGTLWSQLVLPSADQLFQGPAYHNLPRKAQPSHPSWLQTHGWLLYIET